MTRCFSLNRSSGCIVAFIISVWVVAAASAQQAPTPAPRAALAEGPQVIETADTEFEIPTLGTFTTQGLRIVVIKGLRQPWAYALLPDGSMLVTERAGQLRLIRNGVVDPQPITGIPAVNTAVNKGLMDIVLHPSFAENRLVYFTYSKPMPGDETGRAASATLARGRFDGGTALTEVEDLLVTNAWAMGAQASRIVFGTDGLIYMSVGIPTRHPIGQAESAQDPRSLAGKILRLNDDGTPASDNPFVGRPMYRPEIYALGIRNALALVFHPTTGELWETENGPMGGDEINIIRPGLNYGWPIVSYGVDYSGNRMWGLSGPTTTEPTAPGMEEPFLFWVPSIAVSGMTFYTGDKFPAWKGNIFVGGLRGAQLQRIILTANGRPVRRVSMLTELKLRIREVKQGPDGFLYLLTGEEDGALLRIEPIEPLDN